MKEGIHYAKKLEAAVLGACLLENTAVGRTYGIIEADTFYLEDHKRIYGVLTDMFDKSFPIDCITVWHQLIEEGKGDFHAGNIPYYLCLITTDVVSTAHLEYHCHILKEMWRKRKLEHITRVGIDPMDSANKTLSSLYEVMNEIKGQEYKQDWQNAEGLMYGLAKHQQNIREGKVKLITTGFKAIDNLNGGFYAGQMIVVGARPSMGKSALVGKIALEMARQNKKVGIISLEMDNNQIAARLASLETDLSFQDIYRNLFQDQAEYERFQNIISNRLSNLPIFVSDKTRVDVNEIKAKAAKLKNKVGCDCLIIDYLQLVETATSNKNYNREQEVAKISRGLKLLAMELEIPVIVVCQLNREGAKRTAKDRYPKETDLRESGSIEQDADAIILLHRDWKAGYETDEDGNSTEYEADLLGVKWRNGAMFHLKLDFDPPKMKFSERPAITTFRPLKNFTEPNKEDQPF